VGTAVFLSGATGADAQIGRVSAETAPRFIAHSNISPMQRGGLAAACIDTDPLDLELRAESWRSSSAIAVAAAVSRSERASVVRTRCAPLTADSAQTPGDAMHRSGGLCALWRDALQKILAAREPADPPCDASGMRQFLLQVLDFAAGKLDSSEGHALRCGAFPSAARPAAASDATAGSTEIDTTGARRGPLAHGFIRYPHASTPRAPAPLFAVAVRILLVVWALTMAVALRRRAVIRPLLPTWRNGSRSPRNANA